ncbi:MAG TPA: M15 family metallopeptidase [Steroidobacteraceae bacterium]|nr:M15 family metallopeptidase [Steroidobacteraceae bacterium]
MSEQICFSPQELTGRSRAHVVDITDPSCSLHRAVVDPFRRLRAAARAAGIDLVPVSSFRDFDRQLAIWNGKHRGERELRGADGSLLDARSLGEDARIEAILNWSALPGASRHHWGTDMDVIDANAVPAGYRPQLVGAEYGPGGVFARLDAWLATQAAQYGFFRPYSSWRGGVQPEPWHLSHAAVAGQAVAACSVGVLRAALETADMEARAAVMRNLPALVERYVRNFDPPPAGIICGPMPA